MLLSSRSCSNVTCSSLEGSGLSAGPLPRAPRCHGHVWRAGSLPRPLDDRPAIHRRRDAVCSVHLAMHGAHAVLQHVLIESACAALLHIALGSGGCDAQKCLPREVKGFKQLCEREHHGGGHDAVKHGPVACAQGKGEVCERERCGRGAGVHPAGSAAQDLWRRGAAAAGGRGRAQVRPGQARADCRPRQGAPPPFASCDRMQEVSSA